ncbi:sodium pump decarboxylase gamma subunit [Halanaerobium saccharolyticum]|uniref:Sodium pump decarboxylase gamma subunit n=1 Tax=Halanaerobium saccharolyticum TaxID=43595 RepID=A0A4R7YVH0_9FIRM|nr:OadG family protein [Halanaerobium saccharolyticum]RAK06665.1 sodium pump decarboxylase gamma subunit [Halanaerobium saccharolyticum]TDW01204.1 sodium pump decarboxylase gamma subunit [Halanaerobium saccharolyticum]TDX51440.1 sodium pump decarboxylase gamma subunit [Halanaerobium saccharolyticum]
MNNYVLGLELLVIGMGTVFLSLYLLSVFLHFSGKLLGPESDSKKKKEVKTAKVDIVEKSKEKEINQQEISPKKVAAVTAAIYESLNEQKNYRIISIQKSNQNWKR